MAALLGRPGSEAAKTALGSHMQTVLSIRGYALALSATNLTPTSDPPPAWYPGLVAKIAAAKSHVEPWTLELEPAITSSLPGQIVEFANRFQTATDGILTILHASPKPAGDNAKAIAAQLDWLRRRIGDHRTSTETLRATFIVFQTASDADLRALNGGADDIQKDLDFDAMVVEKLTGDLRVDQANIDEDRAAMAKAGIAGGVGFFVGATTLVVSEATGPGALIGGLVMAGAVIEVATVLAVYGKRLAEAQSHFDEDTASLNAEQKQVAALTIVKGVVDNLIGLNDAMSQSLADIAAWWSTIEQKLDAVVDDVTQATTDDDGKAWLALGDDLRAAQEEWADLATFAQNMQDTAAGTTVQLVQATGRTAA